MRSEQIPYGVKDFKRVRLENRYYVVKSQFIERLEARADRIFMTGVSPVTMDDLTSGFNIATNISQEPHFLCHEFRGRELVRLEAFDRGGCDEAVLSRQGELKPLQ